MAFCRLLARDGTPIVSREGGDDYILVRIDACVYDVPPDNTDPPITGGGRVLRKGKLPEWWENWEEPQPTESIPTPPVNIAELIALAASALEMPPTVIDPAPTYKPIPIPQRVPKRAPPTPPTPIRPTFRREASIRLGVSGTAESKRKLVVYRSSPGSRSTNEKQKQALALLLLTTLD